MKITVLQENLKHGLSIVSRATSPRATLPVLDNILVATENGRLRLAATDLELSITCWIGASIERKGLRQCRRAPSLIWLARCHRMQYHWTTTTPHPR